MEERASADFALEPRIPEHHDMSAKVVAEHIAAGERAALAALASIRRLFER
jgi:hypothetical protein